MQDNNNYELDLEVCPDIIEVNLDFVSYIDEAKVPKLLRYSYQPSNWSKSDEKGYTITITRSQHKIAKLINISLFIGNKSNTIYKPALFTYDYDEDTKDVTIYSEEPIYCMVTLFGSVVL